MNKDLKGYMYTLYGFTKKKYDLILEEIEDETTEFVFLDGVLYDKRMIISKGRLTQDYPYKNKKLIPSREFREVGSDRSANKFFTAFYCYLSRSFGEPTLAYQDIRSSWKCMVNNLLFNCTNFILIKEKLEDEQESNINETNVGEKAN